MSRKHRANKGQERHRNLNHTTPTDKDLKRRNTALNKPRTKERTSPGELFKVQ